METSNHSQSFIDNMIALDMMSYTYRLILTYQNSYIETKFDFYLKNIKEIKSTLESHNNTGQSSIFKHQHQVQRTSNL